MWAKRLGQNVPLMSAVAFAGAIITILAAMRLRFAHAFKPFFAQTCIYLPDDEFVPTLVVFLVSVGVTIACSTNALFLSARLRRFIFGLLVASAAFAIALLVHRAI
jgi:hypothetical protein